MSAYGEWCPTCGANIVKVTRGIPSMGTCSNGHVTDRRDTLRRPPADPVAQELAALRAELAASRAREASALEHVRTLVCVARGYQSMPGYLMHPMLADQCDRAALASTPPADTWHERRTMLPDGDARAVKARGE